MGCSDLCVLFADSFSHGDLGDHVDEVRFEEPVVISGCEVVDNGVFSLCPAVPLKGITSPAAFPLEIYVRSGGDARFKRLCTNFMYSCSSSEQMDVQALVADHMVIRGHYSALTMVVYGNVASDLATRDSDGNDNSLSEFALKEPSVKAEDLPEVSRSRQSRPLMSGALNFLCLTSSNSKQVPAIRQLLQFALATDRPTVDNKWVRKVVKTLLSASSTLHPPDDKFRGPGSKSLWSSFTKLSKGELHDESKGVCSLDDIKVTFQQLQEQLQELVGAAEISKDVLNRHCDQEEKPHLPELAEPTSQRDRDGQPEPRDDGDEMPELQDAQEENSKPQNGDEEDPQLQSCLEEKPGRLIGEGEELEPQDGQEEAAELQDGQGEAAELQDDQQEAVAELQGGQEENQELQVGQEEAAELQDGQEENQELQIGQEEKNELEPDQELMPEVQSDSEVMPEVHIEDEEMPEGQIKEEEMSEAEGDPGKKLDVESYKKQVLQAQKYHEERPPGSTDVEEAKTVQMVNLIISWILAGVEQAKSSAENVVLVDSLIAGLAAAQLLCLDVECCRKFVQADGIKAVMSVFKEGIFDNSAICLLALRAVECCSRHAVACESLLGWHMAQGLSGGGSIDSGGSILGCTPLIKLLLQPLKPSVTQITLRVLQRLLAFELVATFQSTVESFGQDPACQEDQIKSLDVLTLTAKKLQTVLIMKDLSEEGLSPVQAAKGLGFSIEDGNYLINVPHNRNVAQGGKFLTEQLDIDAYLLSMLQETRLMPLMAAVLSAPVLKTAEGAAAKSCQNFTTAIHNLLLSLASCKAGSIFLCSEPEAAASLVAVLQGSHETGEREHLPVRYATVMHSLGFCNRSEDIGGILQTNLLAVAKSQIQAIDRLLTAPKGSEEVLWALWDLVAISRFEPGRQALLSIAWFPEAFSVLKETMQRERESFPPSLQSEGAVSLQAAVHFAAEVLQVVVSDSLPSTLLLWIPHAIPLQQALQSSSGSNTDLSSASKESEKDAVCERLLLWVEAAVVYQKRGLVGLLKYASSLAAGAVCQPLATGLPSSEGAEFDICKQNDQGGIVESSFFHGKGGVQGSTAGKFSTAAVIRLTVAIRILAHVSSHPSVAAFLFGEGAMSTLFIVLEHCAVNFPPSPANHDDMYEDADDDGVAEEVIGRAKERLLMGMLLPSLVFLLNLLQRLQAAVQSFRNSKLMDLILRLHHAFSVRIMSFGTVPPFAWTGGTLEVGAICRVLASILACWPVYFWTPVLLPRLLGTSSGPAANATISNWMPLEPGKACSILLLLVFPGTPLQVCHVGSQVDLLPRELQHSKGGSDSFRKLAVGTLLGLQTVSTVDWHVNGSSVEKLLAALVPHLNRLGEMVLQYAPTTCGVLRNLLMALVTKLACQNFDHAGSVVRPVLVFLRQHIQAGMAASELDLFKVERLLEFVADLSAHPSSKVVLLQGGVVDILSGLLTLENQALIEASLDGQGIYPPSLACKIWSLKAFAALCDADISLHQMTPLKRLAVEDCPNFYDSTAIGSLLMSMLQDAPLDIVDVVLDVFERLARHDVGCAAFATLALPFITSSAAAGEIPENGQASVEAKATNAADYQSSSGEALEKKRPPFLEFWTKLLSLLDGDKTLKSPVMIRVVHKMALACVTLASRENRCGLGALRIFCGLEVDSQSDPGSEILTTLEEVCQRVLPGNDTSTPTPAGSVCEKAQELVKMVLHALSKPTGITSLNDEIEHLRDGLPKADPLGFRKEEYPKDIFQQMLPPPEYFFSRGDTDQGIDVQVTSVDKVIFPSFRNLRERFMWECPAVKQDKPAASNSISKRRHITTVELGNKRHRADVMAAASATEGLSSAGAGSTVQSGRAGSASVSSVPAANRRDTFRHRKPNTSRPPSMHVDDYVARERNVDGSSGGASSHRNTTGGRPPSIHVDEFMARQRERQQQTATSAGKVMGGASCADVPRPMESTSARLQDEFHAGAVDSSTQHVHGNQGVQTNVFGDFRPESTNESFNTSQGPSARDVEPRLHAQQGDDQFAHSGSSPAGFLNNAGAESRDATSQQQDGTGKRGPAKLQASKGVGALTSGKSKCSGPLVVPLRPSADANKASPSPTVVLPSPGRTQRPPSPTVGLRHGDVQTASINGMAFPYLCREQRPQRVGVVSPLAQEPLVSHGGMMQSSPPSREMRPPPTPVPLRGFEGQLSPSTGPGLGGDGQRDRVGGDFVPVLAPPPLWMSMDSARRPEPNLLPPSLNQPRGLFGPFAGSLHPPVDLPVGVQALAPPWPGVAPNTRMFEEMGHVFGGAGRPSHLPVVPSPLSGSPGPSMQGGHAAMSPQPYGQTGGSLPLDTRAAYALSPNERRFVSYNAVQSVPFSAGFPPSPSSRPPTPISQGLQLQPPQQQQQQQHQMLQLQQQLHQQQQSQLQPLPPQGHQQQSQLHPQQIQQSQRAHLQVQLQQQQAQQHHQQQLQQQQQLHLQQQQQHQLHQQQQQQQQQLPLKHQQYQQQPAPAPAPAVAPTDSTALLQQMLSSPLAIQELLQDQNKLRQLLEQHPKLITLLQEKMGQGPS